MESIEKIVGYVCCAGLMGGAGYVLICAAYDSLKSYIEYKKDNKDEKEENKRTNGPYFLSK